MAKIQNFYENEFFLTKNALVTLFNENDKHFNEKSFFKLMYKKNKRIIIVKK